MKLKITTYNIHKGVSSFGARPRIHALKQAINSLQSDILFLQEVQGRHDLHAIKHATDWPELSQQDFLAGDSHQCAYGMNAVYDHGHHGNALLSAYPILSSTNQNISDHKYESRGILHCIVRAPETEVHCYVVHLGLFAGSRKRQNDALIEAVKGTAGMDKPVIIAGDFNDWGNRLSEELYECLGVSEVFDEGLSRRGFGTYLRQLSGRGPRIEPARTFPAAMPFLKLDRIYVRGFKVDEAQVMHGTIWAKLSDHAPLVASLSLK
ncbi:MAG TPA: endonuclease/exonuclease/phosphatase family protein [Oxalicibacterium sp.]|nr:endonuclease/exonuclease/phosphatase family protein [Oxalicibacterium sp.]